MTHSRKEPEETNTIDSATVSEPGASKEITFRRAVEEGLVDEVEALLNDGLKIIDLDYGSGVTPLHIAIQEGQTVVARLLLNRGADPNTETSAGWTPFHMVALTGNQEIAQLLLEHGALLDRTNTQGHTPLDLAKTHKKKEMIALLNKQSGNWWRFWK